MNGQQFRITILIVALGFAAYFLVTVVPPLIENPDIPGALLAGFVNPYSSGYAADTISCWFVLAAWVAYEARSKQVRRGWICLVLGLVPGVAVGFAGYLLVRAGQLSPQDA